MREHPTTFHIRPAKGLRIADPATGEYLPESGGVMPRSGFWIRRLKCGDVVLVSAPAGGTDASAAKPPAPGLAAQSAGAPTPPARQDASEASATSNPEPAPESVQETAGQGKKKKE